MKKVMVALMLLLIESLLFYLYTIPTEAWAYSSVFIILIFGGWTGIDEIRKRKKFQKNSAPSDYSNVGCRTPRK